MQQQRIINPRIFVFFIGAIAALSGLLFGFDTGVIAGALSFIKNQFHPSTHLLEFVVSSTVLGALIGALFSGRIADNFGRRNVMIVTAVAFIVGTLIASFAFNIIMLVAGRFVLGLAIGVASYIAPLFISEIAPPRNRGTMVLLNGIAITGGQTLAFYSDYLLTSGGHWRIMIALGIAPALLLMIGMSMCPSSPRWLLLAGKKMKALHVLSKIRHKYLVDIEYQAIEKSLSKTKSSFKEIFSPSVMPVLIIGLVMGTFQQFMGINAIMYYGPMLLQKIGFTSANHQILATMLLGLINMSGTIFAIIVVDKIGRRILLTTGTALAAISLFILGELTVYPNAPHHNAISLICMVLHMIGYSISLGTLFWLLISEIFPLRIRGMCMSFVTAIQWGANFLISSTFLTLLNFAGARFTIWLYAIASLIAYFFCYKKVPETQGVSLETIEDNLRLGRKTRELGK
jgi:SP family galactose:H+ symporter-like MFS transporter